MTNSVGDLQLIREALARFDPKSSASATNPIPLSQLYMPRTHANALDPNRPLVVGNRGAGKSVWSGVLADEATRKAVAPAYPNLELDRMDVRLGFHEAAGRRDDVAPSPQVLASLLSRNIAPELIWTTVLLRAVVPDDSIKSFTDTVGWVSQNIEEVEAALRKADEEFRSKNRSFLLVFDALDRLGTTWDTIRPLTQGILRLTLGMNGYHAMRAKVFMRIDQVEDEVLFQFADASKLKAARIDLSWHSTELYGLLFKTLHSSHAGSAFDKVAKGALDTIAAVDNIEDPQQQMAVFNRLAGEFMGTDRRRGRTYTWLIDHLADAFHETTPRSFLITLQRAAISRSGPLNTVIDHHGIREGVQQASQVRVDQLQEDYPWIRIVLRDLEGLEVPCTPSVFKRRWIERKTVNQIVDIAQRSHRPGPIEIEGIGADKEAALLMSLKSIGVIEERSGDRINMPDIFRVAATIKRRGGVRPPTTRSRHN